MSVFDDLQREDVRLHNLSQGIDRAFTDRDPWMRQFFTNLLMRMKWVRAAILQGGDV